MENELLHNYQPSERGQNVVLIALLMMVFIGMFSLILDGGFVYADRRAAQNAADAGALAGANVLCGLQSGSAYDQAWEYAVDRNGAVDADIVIDETVQVTATMTHDSFFAGMIGHDVVTVTAYAEAGCYNPCVAAVLPVAWACSPPAGGSLEDDCAIETGTVLEPGPLYVVMDSEKADEDYTCMYPPNSQPPTSNILDCDLDDDGEDDLIGGGGRSWLNLDGGSGGASELKGWIKGENTIDLDIHTWIGGAGAVDTSVFDTVADYLVGNIVILPVFNDYTDDCNPEPVTSLCHSQWHEGLDTIKIINADKQEYYHIISFSPYIVTGVSTGNNACVGVCTAKNALVAMGWLSDNAKTIEGYFIEGYEDGMSGRCDNYGGAITIYLDH